MTVRSTPIFIDGNTHPSEEVRLMLAGLLGASTGSFAGGAGVFDRAHGIVNTADLAVTQNGTPNMSVNVAAGGAFVRGTQSANQGLYHLWNDATVNLAIAAADATNPRRDLVIAQVRDDFYSGSSKDGRVLVVTGTPAASPSDPSLSSYPNAVVLARVAVAANATSIVTANITDLRTRIAATGGTIVGASTLTPLSPRVGDTWYQTDTNSKQVYNGTAWVPLTMTIPHTSFGTITPTTARTRSSTSYGDFPGTNLLKIDNFVKYRTDSQLLVTINGSIYSDTSTTATLGVRVNSIDYDVGLISITTTSAQTPYSVSALVNVPTAGTYTVQARWKVTSGTWTVNEFSKHNLTVTEIRP